MSAKLKRALEDAKKEIKKLKLHATAGIKWEDGNVENPLDDRALVGGLDSDGSKIFVGRALINQIYFPANIVPSRKKAYISCGGWEVEIENFQYIIDDEDIGKFSWKPAHGGKVVEGAVMTNKSCYKFKEAVIGSLYIGRALYRSSKVVGKVLESESCILIPFEGEEFKIKDYEVLVYELTED